MIAAFCVSAMMISVFLLYGDLKVSELLQEAEKPMTQEIVEFIASPEIAEIGEIPTVPEVEEIIEIDVRIF